MQNDNPVVDVRPGDELDWSLVDDFIRSQIDNQLQGQLTVSQFASGASNLTFLLQYSNRELVLRCPPPGHKAAGAHSMKREYSIINALKPVYPKVPDIVYATEDDAILGREFYIMEKIEGVIVKDTIPDYWNFSQPQLETFCTSIFDKLCELHNINVDAVGLQDLGKPEGYAERQILGWNKRYEKAMVDDSDSFDDVRQWLESQIPNNNDKAIIHGDFRIDNVMLDRHDPFNVLAVLDWEMATLGDPLMDLGNTLAYWIESSDPKSLQAFRIQPSNLEGMLSRQQLLDYYHQQTGRNVDNFDFYYIAGVFRLAVIIQQIYYRYFHGFSKDKRFATYGINAQFLGNYSRQLINNLK